MSANFQIQSLSKAQAQAVNRQEEHAVNGGRRTLLISRWTSWRVGISAVIELAGVDDLDPLSGQPSSTD